MPKVDVYELEIPSGNLMGVEVGTNCPQGGDSGHGGRTVLRLLDLGGTAMAARINKGSLVDAERVEIILGGDCERETLMEALEFVLAVLRKETQGLTATRTEEIDF
jgi:hypothetical protein